MRLLWLLLLAAPGCTFQVLPITSADDLAVFDLPQPTDGGPDLVTPPQDGPPQQDGPAPTCNDGLKNGNETGVDCGGSCKRCFAGQGCAVPPDCLSGICNANLCAGGLAAYFPFDEGSGITAADASGNGNTGALVAGPTWTTGRVGNALSFNGVSSNVSVPSAASLNVTTGMTISAWVTVNSLPSWATIAMKTGSLGWSDGYGIYYTNSSGPLCGFEAQFANSACGAITTGATFRHVAVTYDETTMIFYLDGSMAGSRTLNGPISTNSAPLVIGQAVGGYTWDGKIDEFRLFNRALTAAEVLQLATAP